VMPESYAHATGSVGMANARQVMYAARPPILSLTGKTSFDDQYFTQTLLPDYQREHPVETANWDVMYDDRGHFNEPHTNRQIGLGTLAVREYLERCRAPEIVGATVAPAPSRRSGRRAATAPPCSSRRKAFRRSLRRRGWPSGLTSRSCQRRACR